jgi:hypothetical protein
MRRLLLSLCCAATPLAAQHSRLMVGLPGYLNKFPIEDVAVPFTLDAPVARSYAAVKDAFAELKLPLDVDDSTGGLVGKQHTSAQIAFADTRMSRLFDCGEKATGGPNADSYRLTIVFVALLDPLDSAHTKLRVGFAAGAVPSSGSRTEGVMCGSKGIMEAKLAELAGKHLH